MEETNNLFTDETFDYNNPNKFPYANSIFSVNFLDEINNSSTNIYRATITDNICFNGTVERR